ncbi:hypothetical protein CTAYLR_006805 [Chrysophaeum taylorii]|uniref:MOCS2A n=1 Tax=Chrysophaeum taylorii TaxID=2483200 RepID=A0AAD7XMY1_9STRA|nr:hypothetical protein CTAYLR_006805 [Chrysophaeum taylorii]
MEEQITVKVLLFASARELAQSSECTLELPRGSKTSDLRRVSPATALASKFKLLDVTSLAMDTAIALNQAYVSVDDDPVLSNGDEVALIPPISGG